MKHWIRTLLVIIVLAAIVISGMHIYINVNGKRLLANKLRDTFKREARVGYIKTSFPFNLIVKDIEVKDLFKVEEVFARDGVLDIFRKNFLLPDLRVKGITAYIEKPFAGGAAGLFSIENRVASSQIIPDINPISILGGKFLFPRFTLRNLTILDSTFIFTDKTIGDKGISFSVKDLNISLENLNFPVRKWGITSFQIKGKIPWHESEEEGKVEAEGWLNIFKKDMEAKIRIEGIDGIYLYPYYAKWVDLEKARIERIRLNFSSDIRGVSNDVTAQCHLELADIVRKQRLPEESPQREEKIADKVLDMFRAPDQGKYVLDFTIRTQMAKPKFGMKDIKNAVENKITKSIESNGIGTEDIVMFPGKIVEGTIKSVANISKAIIVGTAGVFKEVGRIFRDAYRKIKQ